MVIFWQKKNCFFASKIVILGWKWVGGYAIDWKFFVESNAVKYLMNLWKFNQSQIYHRGRRGIALGPPPTKNEKKIKYLSKLKNFFWIIHVTCFHVNIQMFTLLEPKRNDLETNKPLNQIQRTIYIHKKHFLKAENDILQPLKRPTTIVVLFQKLQVKIILMQFFIVLDL